MRIFSMHFSLRGDPRRSFPDMPVMVDAITRIPSSPTWDEVVRSAILFDDDPGHDGVVIVLGAHRVDEYPECPVILRRIAEAKTDILLLTGGSTSSWMTGCSPPVTEARLMLQVMKPFLQRGRTTTIIQGPDCHGGRMVSDCAALLSDAADLVASTVRDHAVVPVVILENQALHTGANMSNVLRIAEFISESPHVRVVTSREHRARAGTAFRAACRSAGLSSPSVRFTSYSTMHEIEWSSGSSGGHVIDDHGSVANEIARICKYHDPIDMNDDVARLVRMTSSLTSQQSDVSALP